jgi:hypothetical protein
MRRLLIITMAAALFAGDAALAQMPSVSPPGALPASPLGVGSNPSVGPVGIPLGATELGTAGLSPMPYGSPSYGSLSSGTPCSAGAAPASGMSGTLSTGAFDGGGVAAMGTSTTGMGAGTASLGAAAPCAGTAGAGGGSMSTSPPSTVSPGGATRPGIPLGSTEIGNAGVSSAPPIPTPSPTPSNIRPGSQTCPPNGASTGILATPSGFPGIC